MKHRTAYLIGIMLIAIALYVNAYVTPEVYQRGNVTIMIKSYNNSIDMRSFYMDLDAVPDIYLQNIQWIMLHSTNGLFQKEWKENGWTYRLYTVASYGWDAGIIHLYQCRPECDTIDLWHELAHACQNKQYKDILWQGFNHTGHFDECLDEIKEAVKGYGK